ncbi:unnamed protein product [Closterium sp. NIES-65]|nr:unnamed protein product [Closterium sp. NIES-65]
MGLAEAMGDAFGAADDERRGEGREGLRPASWILESTQKGGVTAGKLDSGKVRAGEGTLWGKGVWENHLREQWRGSAPHLLLLHRFLPLGFPPPCIMGALFTGEPADSHLYGPGPLFAEAEAAAVAEEREALQAKLGVAELLDSPLLGAPWRCLRMDEQGGGGA